MAILFAYAMRVITPKSWIVLRTATQIVKARSVALMDVGALAHLAATLVSIVTILLDNADAFQTVRANPAAQTDAMAPARLAVGRMRSVWPALASKIRRRLCGLKSPAAPS